MKKHKRDKREFASIARELGISELSVILAYKSAMRKIKFYLLKHRAKRDELKDSWFDLESHRAQNDSD